jgi:hypothetical protein
MRVRFAAVAAFGALLGCSDSLSPEDLERGAHVSIPGCP